jgi:hypothetical protein
MRFCALLLVVVLAPPVCAEESAFPKWKLKAGDRFTFEFTTERTEGTFSARSREEFTDSLKVSARLDVVLVDDDKATAAAVKLNEKWTVDSPDPRDRETLQVTSIAVETSGTLAKLEGKTESKEDVLDTNGKKDRTCTIKGTSKSEFDLEGGYLRSRVSSLVCESTPAGKTAPSRRTTEKKSMTLKPTTPERK